MNQSDSFGFQSFISEKNGFVVVSLVGLLEPGALKRFDDCIGELQALDFSKLVINLRDVTGITNDCIPALARMQKSVRDKQADLRLCGLRPEIRERLTKAGILRPHEISDNLQTALQSLIAFMKKTA